MTDGVCCAQRRRGAAWARGASRSIRSFSLRVCEHGPPDLTAIDARLTRTDDAPPFTIPPATAGAVRRAADPPHPLPAHVGRPHHLRLAHRYQRHRGVAGDADEAFQRLPHVDPHLDLRPAFLAGGQRRPRGCRTRSCAPTLAWRTPSPTLASTRDSGKCSWRRRRQRWCGGRADILSIDSSRLVPKTISVRAGGRVVRVLRQRCKRNRQNADC